MNNIITADFSNGVTQVTTKPVYQYDYGQILQFSGVDLPESYEVHFANSLIGTSKSVLGDANGVEIPYECTQKKASIYALIFIHYGENDGGTKYAITIPVIQRAKPSYDPVTPYEQSTIEKLENTVDGIRTDFQDVQEELNETVTEMQEDVQTLQKKKADAIVNSASGSVAAFADGADDMPVERLKCYIEPVQSGSGTPSPSNVRPISGFTGVNVTRTGKNLVPRFTSATRPGGLAYSVNDDGEVTVTGTNTSTAFWATKFTLNAGTYILTGAPSGGQLTIRNAEGGSAPSSEFSGALDDYGSGATFTVSARASAWLNIRSVAGTHNQVYKPMIRLASETDATYEPYTARTLSVTFPTSAGTVYGGYVDVVKGELVVDRAIVDLGTMSWQRLGTNTSGKYRFASFDSSSWNIKKPIDFNAVLDNYCSICDAVDVNEPINNRPGIAVHTNGNTIMYIEQYSGMTAEQFKAEVANEKFCYLLATKTTHTLTSQELNTLLGSNSIYCDTGDVEVSYPADTKLYIDGKIAELQALVLEN